MSMYPDDKREIVTIFSRTASFRHHPSLVEDDETMTEGVPTHLRFLLPDGKVVVEAATSEEIVIGRKPRPRDPQVTVQLDAYEGHKHGVSRYHAMIAVIGNHLALRDLDSINGTLLNGRRCVPLQSYALRHGDEITVGKLKLILAFVNKPRQNADNQPGTGKAQSEQATD